MARKVKVDFTGVESFVKCEEGQHVARIKEVEEAVAQSGNDMLVIKYEVIKGECTGAIVRDNLSLVDKALWKFKALLDVLGMKNDGKVLVDIDKLVGKTLVIDVKHEEVSGTVYAKVDHVKKLTASKAVDDDDDDFEDDDDEEEPAPKAKKPAAKPKKKPEPEPEDDEDDEDLDDEDDDDEDEEPEETPKQKKARLAKEKAEKEKAAAKKAAAKKPKAKPEPEEDEDDDDDWDEE